MNSRIEAGKPRTVAEYISAQINLCGRKQLDIAKDIGFDTPNVITMIKQGKTKLPLTKIAKMAKAIGVDPVFLLRLCMNEYMPDTWETIEKIIGAPPVTRNELEIIEVIRSVNPNNPKITSDEEMETLKGFAEKLKGDNEVVNEEEYK